MNAIEQADQLQQQAVELLLAERQRIDDRLAQLQGTKKDPDAKRRGRPSKQQLSFRPDTNRPNESSLHSASASSIPNQFPALPV